MKTESKTGSSLELGHLSVIATYSRLSVSIFWNVRMSGPNYRYCNGSKYQVVTQTGKGRSQFPNMRYLAEGVRDGINIRVIIEPGGRRNYHCPSYSIMDSTLLTFFTEINYEYYR